MGSFLTTVRPHRPSQAALELEAGLDAKTCWGDIASGFRAATRADGDRARTVHQIGCLLRKILILTLPSF